MPFRRDIDLYKGQTFVFRFNATGDDGTYKDLSGYSGRGYIKSKYSDTGVLLNLYPTIGSPTTSGIVDVVISGSQSTGLAVGRAVYDVEVYTTGDYSLQILKGYVNIYPEVTF